MKAHRARGQLGTGEDEHAAVERRLQDQRGDQVANRAEAQPGTATLTDA